MLIKKEEIKPIPKDVYWLEDEFVFKEGNSLTKISYTNLKREYLELSFDRFSMGVSNGYFYLRTLEILKVFSRKFIELVELGPTEYYVFQVKEITDNYLVCRIKKDGTQRVGILNFQNQWIKVFEIENPITCVSTNSILIIYHTYLKEFAAFDVQNEFLPTWKLNTKEIFEHYEEGNLNGNIIEHQGKLFFSLGNLYKSEVYVLDALTGKLLFQTEEIGGTFMLANDLLYRFNGEILTIFNPMTYEFVKKDFTDLLKPGNLRYVYHGVYQNMAIEGNLLYYASLYGDRDANYTQIALVVLDIDKVELVEVIPFPSDGGAIIDVQVHKDRLFALTTSDVLHVFER